MSNLFILRTYAQKAPSSIPPSILFSSSPNTLTIFDAFPKSIFHFLVLPRLQSELSTGVNEKDLDSLRTLLASDKQTARCILNALKDDAKEIKRQIEEEMMKKYKFTWPIWIGFHGAPSMHHLHLHVLSSDLCSPKLKHKKHYNSFHPKLGSFLHIDEVLSWFDGESSYYEEMSRLDEKAYEKLLKEDLACWQCESPMKNIPTLKDHLQEEWNTLSRREKARVERKRKMEEKNTSETEGGVEVKHIEKKSKSEH
ncbi:hypothetical protein GYMLUDRAFT_44172 [Collybiopsis luxurians FD-317 M1]|uniref:Aprataxin C2HE/C2H2/C2HC zinc finger domain-containing protein n=1 Tax=Collybiopsis luxurians FD-317 M1 TaxID=944289 RepID=A0A0D0BVZ7_9AGAR|nr:hypothetical protein GYMLUDRAFT_44172 [Collybiopsis luxurians FD-317 M1]